MGRPTDLLKWAVTLGKAEQDFLGARWVPAFLRRVPESSRRKWALRLLDLSPHYFLENGRPARSGLSRDERLEVVSEEVKSSRQEIFDHILKDRIHGARTVMDYGCGPGYLARIVSDHVESVCAVDISRGALACAEALNGSPNISWVRADESGLEAIADSSVDLAFSFHMFQHLSSDAAAAALSIISRKLTKGGRLVAHVQFENELWKAEDEWRSDASLKGRIKMRYGLHCFGRSSKEYADMLVKAGFSEPSFTDIRSTGMPGGSSLDGQYLAESYKV